MEGSGWVGQRVRRSGEKTAKWLAAAYVQVAQPDWQHSEHAASERKVSRASPGVSLGCLSGARNTTGSAYHPELEDLASLAPRPPTLFASPCLERLRLCQSQLDLRPQLERSGPRQCQAGLAGRRPLEPRRGLGRSRAEAEAADLAGDRKGGVDGLFVSTGLNLVRVAGGVVEVA